MLGWALKRGGAKDASGPDDTQIEQPDTPAPVFAVRALKTAIFGTPAPKSYQPSDATNDMPDRRAPAAGASDTPAKPVPAGILLTPGTGTTRRKRVSFGHDVKSEANGLAAGNAAPAARPKTRLTQALENSRKNNNKSSDSNLAETKPSASLPKDTEDIWEEVDEDGDPEVTVDLNEPHSRSGKYWKSCFESYHADAKAEMEKLVKYKQLAKSYAKMKDSEALDLQQKLGEEQEHVKEMEEKVAELSRNIHAGRARGDKGSKKDSEMVAELQKQTALATDYRLQVEELEEMLATAGQEPDGGKKRRKAVTTSPRTAIIETHRQLRQARAQLKELEDAKDEVTRLRAELSAERRKSSKLAEENRKLAADSSRSSSKIVDLEKKLDDSRNEARTKEREFRRLKNEHEQLKENAKSRFSEAEQVVAKKNETIASLNEEIKSLKTELSKKSASGEQQRKALRRKSYSEAAYSKRSQEMAPEENTTKILDMIESRGRSSLTNGLSLPQLSSNIHIDKDARYDENKKPNGYEDETLLISSRALRDRITTDMGKNGSSSSVLSDRANLQENRRAETSNSTKRHSYSAKDTAEPSLPTLPGTSKTGDGYNLRRKSSRGSVDRKASEIRPSSAESEAPQIDLMQSHFARLGDTVNTSTAWDISTAKTSLPAERRAAAIARLQRKKVERGRSERAAGRNKENALPA